jgi:hypothetical protein
MRSEPRRTGRSRWVTAPARRCPERPGPAFPGSGPKGPDLGQPTRAATAPTPAAQHRRRQPSAVAAFPSAVAVAGQPWSSCRHRRVYPRPYRHAVGGGGGRGRGAEEGIGLSPDSPAGTSQERTVQLEGIGFVPRRTTLTEGIYLQYMILIRVTTLMRQFTPVLKRSDI